MLTEWIFRFQVIGEQCPGNATNHHLHNVLIAQRYVPELVDSEEVTFFRLVSVENRLIVPFLQRNYVWKPEHYDQLMDDIKDMLDQNSKHWTGSIITCDSDDENEGDHLSIIDGQQRLTTLVIICKAAKDCFDMWCNLVDNAGWSAQRKSLVTDESYRFGGADQTLTEIINQVNLHLTQLRHGKKFLTLKENDGARLDWILATRELVQLHQPQKLEFRPLTVFGRGYPRIYKAYHSLFKELVLEGNTERLREGLIWYGKEDEDDAEEIEGLHPANVEIANQKFRNIVKILNATFHKLLFLKMHVNQEQYVYEIFNTVNTLGHKLSRFDILRNQIVSKINNIDNITPEQLTELKTILLAIADDQNVDQTTMSKFIEIYPQTKRSTFNKSAMTEYWDEWLTQRFTTHDSACNALNTYYKHLQFFNHLNKGDFEEPEGENLDFTILNNNLKWINFASVKIHIPLLLNAYLCERSPDVLLKLLKFSEKMFLYLRLYQKDLPQYLKNRIANSLNGTIHKTDCRCRECTNEGEENNHPAMVINWNTDDVDEIINLLTQKFFNNIDIEGFTEIMSTKNDYSSGQSKFILWNIEQYLQDQYNEAEENVMQADVILVHNSSWEQEHIMPKNGTIPNWGEYAKGTDANADNINKIGNHTLYEKIGNIKLGNRSWDYKKQYLPANDQSIKLNVTGYADSDNWTEVEINTRSDALIEYVIAIWFG
jgi:hypothetical protein